MYMRALVRSGAVLVSTLLVGGCGNQPNEPTAPRTAAVSPKAGNASVWGSGRAVAPSRPLRIDANTPPTVGLRTTPPAVGGVVYGEIPLDVAINLCQSSDVDPGDSLRFDVDWGDGVRTGPDKPGAGTTLGEGGGPDGCDGRDCCRQRHRYERAGRFTAEASVSDKHLEDQAQDVVALAISKARVEVNAGTPPPPCTPIGEDFEGLGVPTFSPLGNPLSLHDLSYRTATDFALSGGGGGAFVFATTTLISIPDPAPSIRIDLPFAVFSYSAGMGSNTLSPDQFRVDGLLRGIQVFSHTFNAAVGPSGSPEAAVSGGGVLFDRIVFNAGSGIQVALDDLRFGCQ